MNDALIRLTYRVQGRYNAMIKSYGDKKTEQFANGNRVPRFEPLRRQIEKRLRILEAATSTGDLKHLPSNRFEALLGDRKGQYSIRINQQWRLCFECPDGATDPENVVIIDYH